MFSFFKKKKSNDTKGIKTIVKSIYDGMDDEFATKMFYGSADKACEVLIPMCKSIFENEALSKEQLELTTFVYSQLWIRYHGGFDPSFSEEEYIRERMKERFNQIDSDLLDSALDIGFEFIRENEHDDSVMTNNEVSDEIERELIDVLNQTANPPIGSPEEAWEWSMQQYEQLKAKGAPSEGLNVLAINMITNLTDEYVRHYHKFRDLIDGPETILIAFGVAADNKQFEEAKKIADPYIDNELKDIKKYAGQYCLADEDEARVFRLANPHLGEIDNLQINITAFIIRYCSVLNSILHSEKEPDDETYMKEKVTLKKELLSFASDLSPCNAEVWQLLAQCYANNEVQKWYEAARNALNVCTDKNLLGNIYADMAMHYAVAEADSELAEALYTVSKRYCNNMASAFVLSKMDLHEIGQETADSILEKSGIQNGFSDLVQPVIEEHLIFEKYPNLDRKMALLMDRINPDMSAEIIKILFSSISEVEDSGLIQPDNKDLWDAVHDSDPNIRVLNKSLIAKRIGESLLPTFGPIPINDSQGFFAEIEYHREFQYCIVMVMQEIIEDIYREGIFDDNDEKGEPTRIILKLQNEVEVTDEFRQAVANLAAAYDDKPLISVMK